MSIDSTTKNLTFENAIKELESIVSSLESGQVDLDKSIAAYKRGIQLKDFCDNELKKAKLTIEKLGQQS